MLAGTVGPAHNGLPTWSPRVALSRAPLVQCRAVLLSRANFPRQGPVLANTTLNTYLNILGAAQRRQSGGTAAEAADDAEDGTDEVKLFGPRQVESQAADVQIAANGGKHVGQKLRF
jgi:hypothetical protein